MRAAIGIVLAILVAVILMQLGGHDPTPTPEQRRIAQEADASKAREAAEASRGPNAKFVCEKFVRSRLKAPSTAKFADQNEFLALRGKAKKGEPSEASLIALSISQSLRNPAVEAIALDKQINFLKYDEYRILFGRSTRIGEDSKSRALVQAALERQFKSSDYVVTGFVDAQNSFGATLRSSFICMTSEAGNNHWTPDAIALVN